MAYEGVEGEGSIDEKPSIVANSIDEFRILGKKAPLGIVEILPSNPIARNPYFFVAY